MDAKWGIRKLSQNRRHSLSEEERKQYSRAIAERIIKHPVFAEAQEVYCYASYKDEVSTGQILEAAWSMGKKAALPRITGKGLMCFYYVKKTDCLYPNSYGIPEPGVESKKVESLGKNVLILVPGLAFDKAGRRIGYGGGFYDRYLKMHPNCYRMGIAFDIQCFNFVPADEHDVCMETIITEKREIKVC